MKKLLSCVLSISMLCSSMSGLTSYAESVNVGTVVFKHQNVVGSQTCYGDDTAEKLITEIHDVIQGMRINQPVFLKNNAELRYCLRQQATYLR